MEEEMSFDLEGGGGGEDPLDSFDSDFGFPVIHPGCTPGPSLHPRDPLEPPDILLKFLIPCEHPPSVLLPLVNLELLIWDFEEADMLQTRKRSRREIYEDPSREFGIPLVVVVSDERKIDRKLCCLV